MARAANSPGEVDVKNKVLWEIPNSITNAPSRSAVTLNMGYSYGRPVLVKTQAAGWVALVTSGYNNGTSAGDSGGDGLGRLYVINPRTGDLIKEITTPGCSASPAVNPCGLAHISSYVSNASVANTTDYSYGGDLYGNVWRFDLRGASTASWSVSKLTTLTDSVGNVQPITTVPELALVDGKRMVYVGTGLYLGASDVPGAAGANAHSSQTQSMYGLCSKKGWYIDLPTTGERVNTHPTIAPGVLVFTSNIPSSVVCEPGGDSWEYFINLRTGGLAVNSTVPWVGTSLGSGLASRPVLVKLPTGKIVSLVRKSDATTLKVDVPIAGAGMGARRMSWRELFN